MFLFCVLNTYNIYKKKKKYCCVDLTYNTTYISLKVQKSLLKFDNLGDLAKSSIVCFSDAAFANLKHGGSQGAFIIFLYGKIRMPPLHGHQGN